jgi:hypothetical protein
MIQQESGRFFEKKLRKKLSTIETTPLKPPGGQGAKVFCFFFSKKKRFSCLL